MTLVLRPGRALHGPAGQRLVTIEHARPPTSGSRRTTRRTSTSRTPSRRRAVQRVRSIPGVARADNLIVWFMNIALPNGAEEGASSTRSRTSSAGTSPGTSPRADAGRPAARQLLLPRRLGRRRASAPSRSATTARSSARRLKIIGTTAEAPSFTTTPDRLHGLPAGAGAVTETLHGQTTYVAGEARRPARTSRRVRGGDPAPPALQRRLHARRVGRSARARYWV